MEFHREETLHLVFEALIEAGVHGDIAQDAIMRMQNKGILFRERVPATTKILSGALPYELTLDPHSNAGNVHVVEEAHKTKTNPHGRMRQCSGRDIHGGHEWQEEFGAYFNVYCEGNKGKRR